MARFNQARTNFLAGEITPKAFARTDLQQFSQACETLQNMYVHPQGGATRRPGTVLNAAASATLSGLTNIAQGARMIPFVFSATEAYMIVFVVGETQPLIIRQDGTTIPYANIFFYDWNVATSNIFTISQWRGFANATQLNEAQFTQVNDFLIVTQKDVPPFALVRTTQDNFTVMPYFLFNANTVTYAGQLDIIKAFPYRDVNIDQRLVMAATGVSTSAYASFTVSAYVTSNGSLVTGGFWQSTHVGSIWKVYDTSSRYWVFQVTAVTNAQQATAVCLQLPTYSAFSSSIFYEGAWSNARGFPRAVTYFEQRLIYGGNASQPATLWGTQIGDIGELMNSKLPTDTTPVVNSDAFALTMAGANKVQWLLSGKNLNIGTANQEYIAGGSDSGLSLGPGNLGFTPETSYGSVYTQAVKIDSSPIFTQRSGAQLRELVFNYQEDNYRAENISIYSDHLRPQNQLTVQQDRGILWAKVYSTLSVNQNKFFGLTRDRINQIKAFHSHVLGGDPLASVFSISCLPAKDGFADRLWFAVQRTSTSGTTYTIETMSLELDPDLALDDVTTYAPTTSNFGTNYNPAYSDCAVQVAVTIGATTITGLPNVYNGLSVDVRHVQKGYLGRFTVTAGVITLSTAISATGYCIIGFPYVSLLKTTEIDVGGILGSSVGVPKKIDKAHLNFNRTLGAQFGSSETNLEDINFRANTVLAGTQTPLYSGYEELVFPAGWKHKQQVVIKQDQPYPMTVLAITYRGVGND